MFSCVFLLLLSFCTLSTSQVTEEYVRNLIDGTYLKMVVDHPWMGISVGVFSADLGELYYNYGVRNQSSSTVDEDTIFPVNSMTKVFTGISLAAFANSGSLQLEDFIQPFIPDHVMPQDAGKSIMFLDLATHWSGLPVRPDNFPNPDEPYEDYTDDLFFEFLGNYTYSADLHLRRQYYYSNTAFGLCAYIISHMNNTNFSQMMSDLLFLPINMTRSGLTTDAKSDPNMASGHESDGTWCEFGWSPETVLGSWAVRSTTKDMIAFLRANMDCDNFSTPTAKAMQLAQIPRRPTDKDAFKMGLGWRVEQTSGTLLKSGSGDGFESNMLLNKEKGLALVVLSNSYVPSPYPDISTSSSGIFSKLLLQL
jgi:CubicO group peptidase (beta-lactamase class C family)